MAEIHRVTQLLPSNQAWFTGSPIDSAHPMAVDNPWLGLGDRQRGGPPSCVSGWTITFMLGYHGALMGFNQQSMGIFHGDVLGISWIDSGYIQAPLGKNPPYWLVPPPSYPSPIRPAAYHSFSPEWDLSASEIERTTTFWLATKYAWKQCNPFALFLHARKPYLLKSYCSCGSTSRILLLENGSFIPARKFHTEHGDSPWIFFAIGVP